MRGLNLARYWALIGALLLVAACASSAPAGIAPTATTLPTATVAPTATTLPTATIAPTATTLPTATIAPTATLAPPACNSMFAASPIHGYQPTETTDYGVVPLPPLSLVLPDSGAGRLGVDVCSAGTLPVISAYLTTNMPSQGWTQYSATASQMIWKSGKGCVTIALTSALDWTISWPNSGIGSPFAYCP